MYINEVVIHAKQLLLFLSKEVVLRLKKGFKVSLKSIAVPL